MIKKCPECHEEFKDDSVHRRMVYCSAYCRNIFFNKSYKKERKNTIKSISGYKEIQIEIKTCEDKLKELKKQRVMLIRNHLNAKRSVENDSRTKTERERRGNNIPAK